MARTESNGMLPQGFDINEEFMKRAEEYSRKYAGGGAGLMDTPEGRMLSWLRMWRHGVATAKGGMHAGPVIPPRQG